MMTDHEPVTPEELLAHADGRLPESRRSAVEAHLAAHPEAAAEVEHWRRQNDALHALFDGVAEEPVPARLSPHRTRRCPPMPFSLPKADMPSKSPPARNNT